MFASGPVLGQQTLMLIGLERAMYCVVLNFAHFLVARLTNMFLFPCFLSTPRAKCLKIFLYFLIGPIYFIERICGLFLVHIVQGFQVC